MITLENITLIYGGREVLKDFSLHIPPGQRLVILGASGSGKTTLLRLIAGFVAPVKGKITIDGTIVAKEGKILIPPHKRAIGMVFQDLALWPHMNVEENIAFGLKVHKVPRTTRKEKVREMLRLVGLEGYEKRRIDQLSGGQQQRVALARALALSPKVLLMDEPLSSLDPELNRRLRKEIVRLHEALGFTLVYVTHSEEEAEETGERKIVLKGSVSAGRD